MKIKYEIVKKMVVFRIVKNNGDCVFPTVTSPARKVAFGLPCGMRNMIFFKLTPGMVLFIAMSLFGILLSPTLLLLPLLFTIEKESAHDC